MLKKTFYRRLHWKKTNSHRTIHIPKILKRQHHKYAKKYLNLIINKVKRKKGINDKYKVDQSHLIRKLKKILIHNDTKPRQRKHEKIDKN